MWALLVILWNFLSSVIPYSRKNVLVCGKHTLNEGQVRIDCLRDWKGSEWLRMLFDGLASDSLFAGMHTWSSNGTSSISSSSLVLRKWTNVLKSVAFALRRKRATEAELRNGQHVALFFRLVCCYILVPWPPWVPHLDNMHVPMRNIRNITTCLLAQKPTTPPSYDLHALLLWVHFKAQIWRVSTSDPQLLQVLLPFSILS